MSISLVLFLSTDPTLLARALMKMRVPFEIAFIMLAAVRFFPIFITEASNISQAQRIRGVDTRGVTGIFRRLRLMAFPLMIGVLRKARTVGLAVETKAFGARQWKEFYREVRYGPLDYALSIGVVLILFVSVYLRVALGIGSSDFRNT
jgi:energy-coupling factor transport system permease protein